MRQTTESIAIFGRSTRAPWVVLLLFVAFMSCGFAVEAKNGNGGSADAASAAPADSIDAGPTVPGNAAFQDLAKDHWAFKDVDFLVKSGYMDGYPDGTFKGRKVVTRYDVALVLGRILRRMEEKNKGVNEATETERAALARLTKEFRDELGLLGVRVDSLERRMTETEGKVQKLESTLPKVTIAGSYRGIGQYIIEPETVGRDDWGDEKSFTRPGLVTFNQRLYLKFTGKPMGDKLEVFYELMGFVQGKTVNKLIYPDYGKIGQNPFDRIDDYVTSIQNDRYAQTNKLHFVSNAQNMKVRVFAGESITGINDPINILTEDTDIVQPYQGAEISGIVGDVTYQGSVLKNDLKFGTTDERDMINGRLVWKLPSKFSPDALSIGTSYAEKINDYKIRGNSNTVRGVDVNYTTERVGKVQATAQLLTSTDYHTDTKDGKSRNLGDQGTKWDVSLQNGGFTGTAKHYDYGREFRAHMAPIWAYDIGDEGDDSSYPYKPYYPDNYKHNGFWGEKLTRFSANYDFGNKLLSIAKNLSMEATWLSKTWEIDPYKPQVTDGYSGRKFTYHLISDFTDSTTLTYDFEQKWDALASEAGTIKNIFELNLKLSDSVNSKGKIELLNDRDGEMIEDVQYEQNDRIGYFEVNSNLNPRVFAKGSVEHKAEWVDSPKEALRVNYIGEATYNLTPTTTLTGGVSHVDYEKVFDGTKSTLGNALLAELKKNFTKKFRGRAFYTRGIVDYKDAKTDTVDRENLYGELAYDINKDSGLKFKFGYDYPDDGRWDITDLEKKIRTQKYFLFEAKANF